MPLLLIPRSSGTAPGWSVVQENSGNTGTGTPASYSVTLGAATTGGSVLIIVNSDSTVGTPAGFVVDRSQINNNGHYVFRKASSTGETSWTVTPTGSAAGVWWVAEISGLPSGVDKVNSTGAGTGSSSRSTGTTATTASADQLVIATWGSSSAVNPAPSWSSQTNSFVERITDQVTTKASGTNVGLSVASLVASSTGTFESTATASGVTASTGIIVTYPVTIGAAPLTRAPVDPVGVTDTTAVVVEHGRTQVDPVGVTETVAVAVTHSRAPVDPVGVTETVVVASTFARDVTDPVGVTDAGQAVTFSRDGVEPVGVTESLVVDLTPASSSFTPSIAEVVGVNESIVVATTHSRSVTDPVGVTDTGAVTTHTRTGVEPVGVTESLLVSLTTANLISRTVSDTVTVTDNDVAELIQAVESVTILDMVGVTDTSDPIQVVEIVAVTTRAAVGASASAATQLRTVANLSTWSAMWDVIPIVGPNTGDGGWRAGDGMWSVTHPNGASAIFSFGDTPVSRITPVVLTGTTATVQGTQTAWVTVLDGSAASFPDGSRVRIYLSDNTTLRYGTNVTRRITGRNSAFGYTNLLLDYPLPSAPAVNDIVKGATGGEEWWMFPPHSSAVLWTNGQMRNVAGIDSWIPRDTSADWYWAGPMVMDGNDLYVFPSKQDDTAVPWADVGRGLFRFTWNNHAAAPTGVTKITTWGLDPCWGAAVVKQGSYFYIFGTYRQRTGTPWFDNEVYVARTTSMATAPTAWEFWTSTAGGTWATGAGYLTSRTGLQVVVPHDDVNGLENTFSAHYDNGLFVLASKRGGVFGSDVALWTSTTVTGPYSRRVVGSAPNDSPTANDQTYLTNAHFNLPRLPNGKVLISVSRNREGQTIQSFFDTDPSWYRAMWLEADTTVRAVTTTVTVGAVPRNTAVGHRLTAIARSTVGARTALTTRHVTPSTVRSTVGSMSSGAARKVISGSGRSAAGVAARANVAHLAASTARSLVGVQSVAVAAKKTAVTGASQAGLAASFLLTGGRLVVSRVNVGTQAVVTGIGHRSVVVARSAAGAYAAVSARKAAPGVSVASAGSIASTVASKAAPAVSRGVAGVQTHNSGVTHRLAAGIRSLAGVTATPSTTKRTAATAQGALGVQGRHSGSLARAVTVGATLGIQAVTSTLKAARAVVAGVVGTWSRTTTKHVATPVTVGAVGGAARAAVTHRGTATLTSPIGASGTATARKRTAGTVRGALATTSHATAGRRAPVTVYSPTGSAAWASPGAQPITGGDLYGGDRDDLAVLAGAVRAGPTAVQTTRRTPVLTGGVR